MKKFKTLLLAGVILGIQGATVAPVQATAFSYHLVDEKTIDKLPVAMYYDYDSGRTMVELKDVGLATKTTVKYDYPEITIDARIVEIKLEVGEKDYTVNGVPMTLPVAPTVKDSHVFLPLFDIVENLGFNWHQDHNGIQVSGNMIDVFSVIDVYTDTITTNGDIAKNMIANPFYHVDGSETMISLDDFKEATQTKVIYNGKTPWITIEDSDVLLDLTIGDKLCKLNQRDFYKLSTPPTMKGDVVYLPIKEVAELLGFRIEFIKDVIVLAK